MLKIKVVGMFLLAVCLSSLYTARITEAAVSPQDVIDRLQTRLDRIYLRAESTQASLSLNVDTLKRKFDHNTISQTSFCSGLRTAQRHSDNARTRFNREIIRETNRALRDLQRIGADASFINDARNRGTTERNLKDALYDELDTVIADAKVIASPCT